MRVVVVGPGRLGRTLALLWERAGHEVSLHGRGAPIPPGDITFLTVPDRAIAEVAAGLPRERLVAHCSGASGLEVLGPRPRAGSLHPLMSFPGPELAVPDLAGVPAAVDGTIEDVNTTLDGLARDLGLRPVRVPGDRRLYHAAAVMAGNFATVLLADAARALAAAGVPEPEGRAMLAPLALASIRNAVADPRQGLTGPIARGDGAILSDHRQALMEHGLDDLRSMHSVLTRRAELLLADDDDG